MRLLRNLAPDAQPDAYDVIGVDPAAPTADIKKRYWRLSLMIHPDKCSHALANEAFQAVSKAARVLQDVGGRQELDAAREDAELKKLAEQVGGGVRVGWRGGWWTCVVSVAHEAGAGAGVQGCRGWVALVLHVVRVSHSLLPHELHTGAY